MKNLFLNGYLFTIFASVVLTIDNLRYKNSSLIQWKDYDLFGVRGFDEFRRVEEVMKEVLHAFQPLLIGNRLAGPLLRHLGFCLLRAIYIST